MLLYYRLVDPTHHKINPEDSTSMNNKIIAMAVGAVLGTAPLFSAQAGVKWYGHLQAEVASESSDGKVGVDGHVLQGGGGRFQDGMSVEDNKRGRLGVKISEDLGNGLKAVAKFEWQVSTVKADIDDGDRNSFVGLKGSFGTIKAGSLKTPYKYMGGVKYDPFVTTNLEARRYGGMTFGTFGQNSFMRDAVGYVTPKMGGFKGWIVYSPDEVDGSDGDYSAGAMYKTKQWEVLAATAHDDDNGTGGSYDAWKIGGKVKFGDAEVVGQYENTSDDVAGGSDDGSLYFIGLHYKMGKTMLVGQLGNGSVDIAGTSVDQDNTYWAIGAVHKFSKKTKLIAGYADMSVDNGDGNAANDSDRSAFSVALRVDF